MNDSFRLPFPDGALALAPCLCTFLSQEYSAKCARGSLAHCLPLPLPLHDDTRHCLARILSAASSPYLEGTDIVVKREGLVFNTGGVTVGR